MLKKLQKQGNSMAVILTRDMLNHLGAVDTVDIAFESGKLVLTAPKNGDTAPRRRQSFRDASESTMQQYSVALANLAK